MNSEISRRYRCGIVFESSRSALSDAVLDVDESGRIGYVGPAAQAPETTAPTTHLPGIVMPGLINAHAHTAMTVLRSVGDGRSLADWLQQEIWPREAKLTDEMVYAGQVLGSAEMLRSGVTTTTEMYLFDEPVVRACSDSGLRAVIVPGIIDALHGNNFEGRLEEIMGLHRRWHDHDDRFTVGFGPHSTYTLRPEQLHIIGELARAEELLVHIHLEETEQERQQVIDAYGKTATQLLADTGLLENKVLGAHGVWLDDNDLALMAEVGAAVTHCPQSNLKLGSGIADVVGWAERGVAAALGTDGPASNDGLDLWYELKLAPSLARGTHRDPGALSVQRAFDMATIAGAKALGLDDVGILQTGYRADFVHLDDADPALRPAASPEQLLTHLVFSGSGRAVRDVWVQGRHVVDSGNVVTVDVEAIGAAVAGFGAQL